jgi:hypothetical protein
LLPVTIATITMAHPATLPVDVLLQSCTVERTRRSGPGGQHRNKVETAVVITHEPTGVRAEASERRSQAENMAKAVFRLQVKLALSQRTAMTEPSPLWKSRVTGQRIAVSPEHADFPAILAEALDALAVADWTPPAAAEILGVSGSQLVKLLKLESEALGLVNARRREIGLKACR